MSERHVAFLRGMNVGGRRLTNEELCGHFSTMGCTDVAAFLASGNVVFVPPKRRIRNLASLLEKGLNEGLGYDVPTFLRTSDEVRSVAAFEPFSASERAASHGKLQVAWMRAEPSAADRKAVLAHQTPADRLAFRGRELYWLPAGKLTDSTLDLSAIEARVGPYTVRTHRTAARLAARFLAD